MIKKETKKIEQDIEITDEDGNSKTFMLFSIVAFLVVALFFFWLTNVVRAVAV
ncbi:MAG: hypothetical protein WCK37_00605 [Candidatus Falkowbacteria bacterium]